MEARMNGAILIKPTAKDDAADKKSAANKLGLVVGGPVADAIETKLASATTRTFSEQRGKRPATAAAIADRGAPLQKVVFADKTTVGIPGPPVGRNNGARRCLRVAGFIATCTAATALAAGTATPATGFAIFLLLLGGVSILNLGVVDDRAIDGDGVSLA